MQDKKILKNIKISVELHEQIKKYCDESGLKLSHWIEKQLKEKIIDLCLKK